jgi:hypothetical protein
MQTGSEGLAGRELDQAVLGVLAHAVRVGAATLSRDSEWKLRLEVLADDLSRAAGGGPVRLRLL